MHAIWLPLLISTVTRLAVGNRVFNSMANDTSVLAISEPDELENFLEQLVISNTVGGIFYGSLLTMEIAIIYMNLFRSSQRSLKAYAEHTQSPYPDSVLSKDSCINNNIGRIFRVILESGLVYVFVWLFAIITDAGLLNEGAETSENAFLPHLAAMYPLLVFLLVVGQKSQIDIMTPQLS
ncbi:hypothetical protein K435DRAFT_852171 [Dendrothele bispora CBS 962.96]|uniref:Uncharacterized protein n=1 Tax=Dendrothele bispora (strain CBS 962.96) TaxID=1314807 RepID=A0A4S8MKH9_DENBC|nr:hypothetical protein K435DRAFT_852171 [Dendrothele bispora CBS 962.96]